MPKQTKKVVKPVTKYEFDGVLYDTFALAEKAQQKSKAVTENTWVQSLKMANDFINWADAQFKSRTIGRDLPGAVILSEGDVVGYEIQLNAGEESYLNIDTNDSVNVDFYAECIAQDLEEMEINERYEEIEDMKRNFLQDLQTILVYVPYKQENINNG